MGALTADGRRGEPKQTQKKARSSLTQPTPIREGSEESRASVTPEMEREYEERKSSLGQEGPLRQPIGFRPPAGTGG